MWLPQFILLLALASRSVHSYAEVSDATLQNLPDARADFDIRDGPILSPILIPRVPGSEGSSKVRQHFVDFIQKELPQWTIEFQNSTQDTPVEGYQNVQFVNIIARRDPPWARAGDVERLNLVAHYDSKLTPEGFVGAIDSAAPCAMILYAARSLDAALTKRWEDMQANGDLGSLSEAKGIQILLLDGEEAFRTWTTQDSLYGARSLAEEWEGTLNPAMSTYHNHISSISLFLLLDLLGSASPQIRSFYETTHWAYLNMAKLERRLRSLGLFKSDPNHPSKRSASQSAVNPRQQPSWLIDGNHNNARLMGGHVEDDHLPFLARGVEVLHVIPLPFPDVWHKIEDDGEHLDMDTVEDWAKLVTAFTAEWFELDNYLDIRDTVTRQTGGSHDEFIA